MSAAKPTSRRALGARGARPAHLREAVAARRPRRRRRARRDPRAAGHGLRRAGRAARRSPASTRRSPASSATRIFGPSRVLVLGPDSSVSPLIFAAITPLLAGGDPATAIALAGMLALLVGLIEIGLGLGQARLRRRPALEGGPGRLHERPRHHDHRRPAAQAVRLLHRRRRLRRRGPGVRPGPRPDRRDDAGRRRRRASPSCSCCRGSRRRVPAVLVAVVGATVVSAALGLADEGVTTVGALPQGVPTPVVPLDRASSDVGPLLIAARRHHARLAHRHHRHGDELRGAARRRGRPRPGDDRHGRRQHRRRASSRASPCRPAARAPRSPSSRAPRARSPASSAPASSPCSCCSSTRCSPTCPQTALAAVVIVAALSLMDLGVLRRYCQVRKSALALSLVATAGVDASSACSRASSSPSSWRSCCSSAATGGPTARCSARSTALDGWHSVERVPGRPAASRASSSTAGRRRCSSPTPASSASRSATSCASGSPRWVVLQCEAITDIDVTAAEMLEQLDDELNAAGRPPGLRRAARPPPGPRRCATGCSRPSTATTSTRR